MTDYSNKIFSKDPKLEDVEFEVLEEIKKYSTLIKNIKDKTILEEDEDDS